MIVTNYTPDDLKKLPLRAIVALAARCARRVQYLAFLPDDHREKERCRAAVTSAIQLAEDFAKGSACSAAEPVVREIEDSRFVAKCDFLHDNALATFVMAARAAANALRAVELFGEIARSHSAGSGNPDPIAHLADVAADLAARAAFTAAFEAVAAERHADSFITAAIADYEKLIQLGLGKYPEAGTHPSTRHRGDRWGRSGRSSRRSRCDDLETPRYLGFDWRKHRGLGAVRSWCRKAGRWTRQEWRTASIGELRAGEGTIFPRGAAWIDEERAYNFSLYAQHADSVVVLLFGEDDLFQPLLEYRLDPHLNKTWMVWHCRLSGPEVERARYYAYRVGGPPATGPRNWHAYDPQKALVDPYAKEVFFPPDFDRAAARQPGPNLGRAPLGVLPGPGPEATPDPERSPRHPPDNAVIYEMHVRGFTQSPTSGVAPQRRGTYLGVVDRIPYLKELGVTMVELLPVHQFDPHDGNYWGYMTLNFFAPHAGYAADPSNAREEFRTMVRALHAAGIEVILDVVYNHTAEGGTGGPTYSYRGIDNAAYYVMSDDPHNAYVDYTGCGNTLACTSICTWTMILDSLRYWVAEMHVDGFRFDLASVLARGLDGSFATADASLLAAIRTDPILRSVPPDRRAVGCRLGLPARNQVPRAGVVPVERPISRRHPPIRPRRRRHGRGAHAQALRQRRPVPG